MNFRKISQGGGRGGVISDLKKIIAILFALETAILVMNFRKKKNFEKGGVIYDLKNFIANLVPGGKKRPNRSMGMLFP